MEGTGKKGPKRSGLKMFTNFLSKLKLKKKVKKLENVYQSQPEPYNNCILDGHFEPSNLRMSRRLKRNQSDKTRRKDFGQSLDYSHFSRSPSNERLLRGIMFDAMLPKLPMISTPKHFNKRKSSISLSFSEADLSNPVLNRITNNQFVRNMNNFEVGCGVKKLKKNRSQSVIICDLDRCGADYVTCQTQSTKFKKVKIWKERTENSNICNHFQDYCTHCPSHDEQIYRQAQHLKMANSLDSHSESANCSCENCISEDDDDDSDNFNDGNNHAKECITEIRCTPNKYSRFIYICPQKQLIGDPFFFRKLSRRSISQDSKLDNIINIHNGNYINRLEGNIQQHHLQPKQHQRHHQQQKDSIYMQQPNSLMANNISTFQQPHPYQYLTPSRPVKCQCVACGMNCSPGNINTFQKNYVRERPKSYSNHPAVNHLNNFKKKAYRAYKWKQICRSGVYGPGDFESSNLTTLAVL